MPGTNLIDAFAQAAGLAKGEYDKRLDMYPRSHDAYFADRTVKTNKSIVVAPGPGLWPGRNWEQARWNKVCKTLLARGWEVIIVGTGREYPLPSTTDLRCKTSMHQAAAVIRRASAFVGIDSFPAHIAGAMGTSRVVLFGITLARHILCDSPGTIAVESDPFHPFSGARHCHERISSVMLGNPPDNPMNTISVDCVLSAIESLPLK